MNTKKKILLGFLVIMLGSCVKYLDPYPNGDRSGEDIWNYQDMIQGLVGQCYDYMPRNYNDNEGAYLDCATDNAVVTSTTNNLRSFAVGTLSASLDPFSGYWDRDYKAIRLVNLFLKDRRGYNSHFLRPSNANLDILVRKRLQGEAFALRAWFQWDLLQKFGGKGVNGEMLGFPIVTEPLDATKPIDYERNTYDQCVKQILDDCDSAFVYLPIAHRDFLVPVVAERTYSGGRYWGRMDGITTVAIKAMVYLTWASPRFNPASDNSRWDNAAKSAKQVMDFKLTVDGPIGGGTVASGTFDPVRGNNWFNPNFSGIVFSARNIDKDESMERLFYPGGFQGTGSIGASQELVNSFPMANGYPVNDPANRGGYNPADPYNGRDPRFYSVIFYNTAKAVRANSSPAETMYTFENWIGGKDASGTSSANSRTNYHIKKFVWMGLNFSDNSPNRQPHAKYFIRWEHMCLTFAEAANKVVGPTNTSKYGISAKDAIKYIRARKTYDGADGFSADPYLDEVAAAGVAAFDGFIRNERRIETCFEGSWFYDLRRWETSLSDLSMPVHGVVITKLTNGTFIYNFNSIVETRLYHSPYLPIPYTEILRMSKLVQNEGWEAWQ